MTFRDDAAAAGERPASPREVLLAGAPMPSRDSGALRGNQRWRDRWHTFRPKGEPIDPKAYEVASLEDDATAKTFVETHHYSGSFPAARERIALYRKNELVGVAVFSVPMHPAVLGNVFPEPSSAIELGRFVLLDDVPGNGETWFLARAFRIMRRTGYTGILMDSDPFPTTTADGRPVFPGHIGTIYQASNCTYLGRTARRTRKLLPDGKTLCARAISKIRSGERGWKYACSLLMDHGAEPPQETSPEGLRAWLKRWLRELTRTVRHPGNHRYAFALSRAVSLGAGNVYPKKLLSAGA